MREWHVLSQAGNDVSGCRQEGVDRKVDDLVGIKQPMSHFNLLAFFLDKSDQFSLFHIIIVKCCWFPHA